jgi:hypothetical protein
MRIWKSEYLGRPKRVTKGSSANGLIPFTRRSFLTGAAGTLASTSVGHAQSTQFEFSIEENSNAILVHFRNERCVSLLSFEIPKIYWSGMPPNKAPKNQPKTQFHVTEKSAPARPDGVAARTVQIVISHARFAGDLSIFDASFDFRLVDQDCQIALTSDGWPRPGKTRFAPLDFVDFMNGTPFRIALKKPECDNLLTRLFAERVSFVGSSNETALTFSNDLSWTLHNAAAKVFSVNLALDGTSQLLFGEMRFAPASGEKSPFDKETLARAFPLLGTPASSDPCDCNASDKSDAPATYPPGMSAFSVDSLSCAADIALGRLGNTVAIASTNRATSFALAQFGEPTLTLSGVTGDFDVVIKQDNGTEAQFRTEGGRIVRYGDVGTEGYARLPIVSKPFEVQTAHGRFVIEAADPVAAEPAQEPLQPGVVLSTSNGQLKGFAVDALLRQATIPFPERPNSQSDGSASVSKARPFFSRGSRCLRSLGRRSGFASRPVPPARIPSRCGLVSTRRRCASCGPTIFSA